MKLNKLFRKYDLLKNTINIKISEIKQQYSELPKSALLSIINTRLANKNKKLRKLEFKIHQSVYESR